MTRADAETLYRVLRSLCIVRQGQTLHVGGHVVGPMRAVAPTSKLCPYCDRMMSERETREQGACNDCVGEKR